ncbi:MAG: D-amino acid aminotransferase [Gammaproteobacteria bacterium]|nr:D-amino acid aminotransferase [Gammaproteobacteria bacterium]
MIWTFLNDKFIPKEEVRISPFNRGFLFGDGVYEVIPAYNSIPFLFEDHLLRLERSLLETNIKKPHYWDQLNSLIPELIEKNQFPNQSIYIQITRGEDEFRSHIPSSDLKSTMFISSNELLINPYRFNPNLQGLRVEMAEDPRWKRSDIKATTLLSNVMALDGAKDEGSDEVIFFLEGYVTEAAASNVFAVFDSQVITTPESNKILSGITRKHVLSLLELKNINCVQENISVKDLLRADEIWLTSSTKEIQPVHMIDKSALKKTSHEDAIWNQLLSSYLDKLEV